MKIETEDTIIAKNFAKQAVELEKGLYTPLSGVLIEAIKKEENTKRMPKTMLTFYMREKDRIKKQKGAPK